MFGVRNDSLRLYPLNIYIYILIGYSRKERSSIALESLNAAPYTLRENKGDINEDFVYSFEKRATDLFEDCVRRACSGPPSNPV